MSLSKKECLEALNYMQCDIYNTETFKYYITTLEQLIKEHFELVDGFKQLKKNYDDLYS